MWRTLIVSVSLLTLISAEEDDSFRVLLNFGPTSLAFFEDVGNQEVIFVQVPSAYMSEFVFEWTFVITGDGKLSDCPKTDVVVLVRKFGLPIPNPQNASYPESTIINDKDTIQARFPLTETYPDENQFPMNFPNSGDITGEYYVSLFLSPLSNPDIVIPSGCKYLAQLTVIGRSTIHYNQATVQSEYEIQTLNSDLYNTDYSLERARSSLLSTDFTTLKEGYNVTYNSSVTYSWIVEPYSDVGGTLRVTIGFGNGHLAVNGSILRACLSRNSYGGVGNQWNNCTLGYPMVVDSKTAASQTQYWPFPKTGIWVLAVGVDCQSDSCIDLVTIDLNVDVINCIESCHSDNDQGDCKLYRTDVLFFSACDCKGGWQGIACTDGTNAVPRSRQLLMTLLLTLSNFVFFPCGVLAVIKRYYSESVVYFFVMFFSTFYHACDNDFAIAFCLIPSYNTLQFSDFYGSITAMWVTLIAVAKLSFRLESFFHVIGIMAIGVAVTYNRFSALTTLIPVLFALFILAIKWGKQCRATRHCYPEKWNWLFSIVPGSICAIVGFVLFAFVETPSNYFYVHSMWHVLMGCAVLFLIPKEKKHSWLEPDRNFSFCDSNVAGTLYSNVNIGDTSPPTVFRMEMSDSSSTSS